MLGAVFRRFRILLGAVCFVRLLWATQEAEEPAGVVGGDAPEVIKAEEEPVPEEPEQAGDMLYP